MKKVYAFFVLASFASSVFAQTTFDRVYTILQTNCTGSCHNTANNLGNLDLTGIQQDVHAALVNVTPSNTTAASKGLKLVDPGDPRNSFLFKKINQGLDANLSLDAGEGGAEPNGGNALTQVEREMIRQWILFGAKDTGTYSDEQTITDFYVNQGGQPRIQTLAPPLPNEGVQLYFGPLFLQPGVEVEYNNKFYVRNTEKVDVIRMNTVENPEAHHFAVYKYHTNADLAFPKGLQKVEGIIDAATLFYSADVIAQWPNDIDIHFPQGTGYEFDSARVMDLNYHLINYNDSVLAAEVYLNIYYVSHRTNNIPISTAQIRYGGDQVGDLIIPSGVDSTYVIDQFNNDSAFFWNIISMQAHTHKLGKDFNVWTRNTNGTKDSLVYKGSFDPTYTFDQGVYIWDNPPYRQFDPPMAVDMRKGMIHEARFFNYTPNTVGFGLTTNDEMFVTFIVYYKSEFPTGVNDETFTDENLKLYPNPVNNTAYIQLNSDINPEDLQLKLYDLLGNEVAGVSSINSQVIRIKMDNLPNGCYIYKLAAKGNVTSTGKIILQR